MTCRLLAEFRDAQALQAALAGVKERRYRALDAFTPYPVPGLADQLDVPPSRIRWAMLVGGAVVAAVALGLQWYSATRAYPLDSGGRPLNSWQVFMLVPVEVGIFAAALAGVIALLVGCGLPRLHHPLFDIPGFERATQDRFFLLAGTGGEDDPRELRRFLETANAVAVTEVRS